MVKARFFTAVFGLTATGLMIFDHTVSGITILAAMALYFVSMPVILRLALRSLTAELSFPDSGVTDEILHGTLRIRKGKFTPIPQMTVLMVFRNQIAAGSENFETAFPFSLKEEYMRELAIVSENCGRLDFRIEHIKLHDFLGVISMKKKVESSREAVVFPGQVSVFPRIDYEGASEEDSPRTRQNRNAVDMTEIFGIREYKQGDNIKNIHWKLSAKTDELMIKELGNPQEHEFVLLLETATAPESESDAKDIDAAVSACQALGEVFLRENLTFKLSWNEHDTGVFNLVEIHNHNEFTWGLRRAIRELGKVRKVGSEYNYPELLYDNRKNKLIYITTLLPYDFYRMARTDSRFSILYASTEEPVSQQGIVSFSEDNMSRRLSQMTV